MLRQYFNCNERLELFLTCFCNILCYVGPPYIQIVSLLSPHFIFPKSHLIFTTLYNFPTFSQQNKFCFAPTSFPALRLPQLYTFFPLSPFFNLLPSLDIFCRQCPVRDPVPSLSNSSSSL